MPECYGCRYRTKAAELVLETRRSAADIATRHQLALREDGDQNVLRQEERNAGEADAPAGRAGQPAAG